MIAESNRSTRNHIECYQFQIQRSNYPFYFYPYVEYLIKRRRLNRIQAREYQFQKANFLSEMQRKYQCLIEEAKQNGEKVVFVNNGEKNSQNSFTLPSREKVIDQLSSISKNGIMSNYPLLAERCPTIVDLLVFINKHFQIWSEYQLKEIKSIYQCIHQQKASTPTIHNHLSSKILQQITIFNKKNQTGFLTKTAVIQMNFPAQMLSHYIEHIQRQMKQLDKKNYEEDLSTYIGSKDQFFRAQKNYRDLFFRFEALIQQKFVKEKINQTKAFKSIKAKHSQSQKLFRHPQMNIQNLCCSSFFYKDRNLYDQKLNHCKFTVIDFVNQLQNVVQNIKRNRDKIKKQVCGLLNGGGGAILFSCIRTYCSVHAKGSLIRQDQKEAIILAINKILEDIFPSPKTNKNILISFVPIFERACRQDYEEFPFEQQLKKDYYVLRIVVRPTLDVKQYCFLEQDQYYKAMRYKSLLNTFGYFQIKPFPQHKVQKVVSHQTIELSQQQYIASEYNSSFDHQKCCEPIAVQKILNNEKAVESQAQQQYEHVSVLILNGIEHLAQVHQRLAHLMIDCKIIAPFQFQKLEFSEFIAIILHNVPVETLQGLVSYKDDFRFDQNCSILLQIPDFVKLKEENIKEDKLKMIKQVLKRRISYYFNAQNCVVQILFYENQFYEKQYYVKTESKIWNLFACLYLNSQGEESSLTNPKHMLKAYQIY